jgi:type IV pilus assembly protein PilB
VADIPDQGSAPAAPRRRRIGELLVEQQVISAEQLQTVLGQQSAETGPVRRKIGQLIVANNWATEIQVARALASALRLPLIELERTPIDNNVGRMLPRAVAERQGVLVINKDPQNPHKLKIAVVDPTNVFALDDVRLYTKATDLEVCVAADTDLRNALARVWSLSDGTGSAASALLDDLGGNEEAATEDDTAVVDDAPVVRLVDMILADAVRQKASDVHVECQLHQVRVRFRVDGLLREVMTAPKSAAGSIVSRLKILSGLDIAERRRPQDGRARLVVDGTAMDCRVSTLPSLHGEKVVLRLLARSTDLPPLGAVGMEPDQLDELITALNQPQGLVLITGPTGSGKTSTLYGGINEIASPDKNIVTLEDPVEISVAGITQVGIQTKAGLTFASGLRSILRQDPDVVLVGEIRDIETAGLAMEASLTGHLVLSTLHTNDAVGAITRLIDMGIEPFLVAGSLAMVVAQRLVRRPCGQCVAPYVPTDDTLTLLGLSREDMASATPMKGTGCMACGHTGYRGRTGIYEVLPISPAIRQILLSGAEESAIARTARAAGMYSLRASALRKASRGETSYEEVLRVTTVETHSDDVRCTGCKRGLSDEMVCCPYCATAVVQHRCRSCRRALEADWSICPYCSTSVLPSAGSAGPVPVQISSAPDQPAS